MGQTPFSNSADVELTADLQAAKSIADVDWALRVWAMKLEEPMHLRPLVIDDQARAAVQKVMDWAAKPENTHLIGPGGKTGGKIPGDDERFVAHLGSYRCVFTFSKTDEGLFRHLTISVPGKGYPNPVAVCEIARLFAFTGWDGHSPIESLAGKWGMGLGRAAEHCIVVYQRIENQG